MPSKVIGLLAFLQHQNMLFNQVSTYFVLISIETSQIQFLPVINTITSIPLLCLYKKHLLET